MSLIIKGMEVPKNGEMKELTIGRAPNGSDHIAIAHGDTTEFYKVVVIPTPHGRLIDADALLKQPMNTANYPKNYVNVAPTIIEAEVMEE